MDTGEKEDQEMPQREKKTPLKDAAPPKTTGSVKQLLLHEKNITPDYLLNNMSIFFLSLVIADYLDPIGYTGTDSSYNITLTSRGKLIIFLVTLSIAAAISVHHGHHYHYYKFFNFTVSIYIEHIHLLVACICSYAFNNLATLQDHLYTTKLVLFVICGTAYHLCFIFILFCISRYRVRRT